MTRSLENLRARLDPKPARRTPAPAGSVPAKDAFMAVTPEYDVHGRKIAHLVEMGEPAVQLGSPVCVDVAVVADGLGQGVAKAAVGKRRWWVRRLVCRRPTAIRLRR